MKSIHLLSVAVFVMAYIYNYDQLANAEMEFLIEFLGLQDYKATKIQDKQQQSAAHFLRHVVL